MNAAPAVFRADIALEAAAEHAEGPLWDARDASLIWVARYRGSSGVLVEQETFALRYAGSP